MKKSFSIKLRVKQLGKDMNKKKKIYIFIVLFVMITAMCTIVLTRQYSIPQALSERERKVLENHLHLSLPIDTVILDSSDGGGRDVSFGFYCWLLYSPSSGIILSPESVPSPESYMPDDNTSDTVKWFQGMTKKHISTPTTSSSLSWETEKFEIRGTFLQTRAGNYLYIQRFTKTE